MNTLRKLLAAAAVSTMMLGVSSQTFADEEQIKMIEALKLEVAQLTGVTVAYDQDSQILTIFGISDDQFKIKELVGRMEALDNVKEVRNNVTINN